MEEKPVRGKKSQFVIRKSQLVVSNQVMTNACCGLAVIFCRFISLLIGRETINIPEILTGVHGFMRKTVIVLDFPICDLSCENVH